MNKIPDNRSITSSLNNVNRNLKKKKIDYVKVKKDFEKAYNLYMQKNNKLKLVDDKIVSEFENYFTSLIDIRATG